MNVRKRLRELLAAPGLTLMPGAYDAFSARVIAAAGFEAVAAGGYVASGSLLAEPDTGQLSMRDFADHYARVCAAVEVPVYVDADTGFGGVHNVRQTIRAFERAGVAGLFIGDQVFPNRCGYLPGKNVIGVEEMVAKIKAALDARQDQEMVIAARTDAMGVHGLEEAIYRCQAYMEAGADLAKPQGVDKIADIKRVIREVPGPHMATMSQAAGRLSLSIADLEAAGARAVTFPSIMLFAAAQAMVSVVARLKRERSLDAVFDDLLPLDSYYDLVGLKGLMAREESYDIAARQLMETRQRKAS